MNHSTFQPSKGILWTSYTLQGLIGAMFLMAAFSNILQTESAVKGLTDLDYDASASLPLGIILLVSTILFLIPKTKVLGAALLTGWLGGAVASHMIHGDPLLNSIIPVIFGIVIWVSIWLRDGLLRKVFPIG